MVCHTLLVVSDVHMKYKYCQVRAANSLLSITHSMKLLLLLSDEAQIAHRRDAELKSLQEEKGDAKQKVAALLDDLLKQPGDKHGANSQAPA
jgi:mediator of RNA polymerase II transcription subunit 22